MRAIIDPGVLVAAIISDNGAPRLLLRAWLAGVFELAVSPALLAELDRVLQREKFRKYATWRDVNSYLALLRRFATLAPDVTPTTRLSPDPKDQYLLALAAAENVDCLVSGDLHLTKLRNSPVRVLTPRAFLDPIA